MSEGPSRNRILILFAHPALEKSRVNRHLVRAVRDLPGITFQDLYEAYPDLDIDVAHEQSLLESHDLIVLQHPFFWYSAPAILKEWEDLVLEHGWAYGHEGTALRGKRMMSAITTGARQDAYGAESFNKFTIRQFLAPIERTACLCGMDYLPPFVVHGTHSLSEVEIRAHAEDYSATIQALRDGTLNLDAARNWPRLNERLAEILPGRVEG